jgi:hypothetical protein
LSGVYRNVGRGANEPREALSLDEKPMATFRDIGAGFKDGLPLRPWAKELLQKRMADNSKDNPDVWCLQIMKMICLENNQSIHHLVGADGPATPTRPKD